MLLPRRAFAALLGLLAALTAFAAPAAAQGQFDRPKYASIVVDANSAEVLYALRADQTRFPASLTKIMTLYLTFEALATGRLSPHDMITVSREAASQAPSKLGLREGESITVHQAMQAVAVKSANDMAYALAERLGGSNERFAALMTLRAQELGMKHTRFVNPHGLPDGRQVTTARDLAILSRAVMRDYPQYYGYFSQKAFDWRGQHILNHNRLLLRMAGMDGLKTGYTNAAGFNLAASAVRDGRRLITVVLGGSSTAARDENVETLLNAGFEVLDRRSNGQPITLASLMNEPDDTGAPIVRAPYEMGSGEQQGLKVVVAGQPVPNPPEAAPVRLARADLPPPPAAVRLTAAALRVDAPQPPEVCDTVAVRRRGRRVHERRCRPGAPSAGQVAGLDCRRMKGARLRACRAEVQSDARHVAANEAGDCRGLRGRPLRNCRSQADGQQADVARAALRDCDKAKGRKARSACQADAPATLAKTGGAYSVQVGAFGSRKDAAAHLAKLSRSHGQLFGTASESVQSAGKSFRARFAGLSQSDAKDACKRLALQGERCMVVR